MAGAVAMHCYQSFSSQGDGQLVHDISQAGFDVSPGGLIALLSNRSGEFVHLLAAVSTA
ncbi:hypothetical protein [Kutzneria sp. NPDC051319]|uniref:hypothetical protein n=1 Tax=Kutzneria sp. NPDC051319 TaxID=3155047 RepID=UPI0034418224